MEKTYLLGLDAGTLSELLYCTLTQYIPVGGPSWMGGWSWDREGYNFNSTPLLSAKLSLCFNHETEMDGVYRTSLAFRRFFPSSSWLLQLGLDKKNLRSFLVTPMGNGQL